MPNKDPEKRRQIYNQWYAKNKHKTELSERMRKTRKRTRDRRREWFEEIKSQFACTRCNNSDIRVLDFHHLDPKKKDLAVSKLVKSTCKEKVLEEISKCICLCANCHRIVHWEEKHSPVI